MLGVIKPEEYDLGVTAHTLSSPFNCDFLGEPVAFSRLALVSEKLDLTTSVENLIWTSGV
ncbi:hypothetical protein CsSME_00007789 [Camellia sinensis var. sinensis]